MQQKYTSLILLLGFVLFASAEAQQTTITINPTCQKFLGEVSELDRSKYFNIHNSSNDEEMKTFMREYNVGKGRMFWGPFSVAKSKMKEAGKFPSVKNRKIKNPLPTEQNIATEHPATAFKPGMNLKSAAKWAVNYYTSQSILPEYFEPMNEPFVHAKDFYTGGWNTEKQAKIKKEMAFLFAECSKAIHKSPALAKMKVIGYSSAWPSVELKDFEHWNDNMKMFMDTAGEHMDAFATHLYDGINVEGQDNIRSGSNAEAILDLIETYSFIKWNTVKPHAITEYGAIEKGYGPEYSDVKSIQTVRSINHILFSLLDREDRLSISIPFITGKATWFINEKNNYQPYQAVLWRPLTIEKTNNPNKPILSNWTYTSRINFYDLWKNVSGERVDITSSNPDIQTQAFVDGKKLHIALSNLDNNEQKVDLTFVENTNSIVSIHKKGIQIFDKEPPVFTDEKLKDMPTEISLIKDETIVITCKFKKSIEFSKKKVVTNTYSKTYLKDITANEVITFNFENTPVGKGTALLKMGIGRKHDRSKKPVITINDQVVEVPDNWKGYDQVNRDDFFGIIEIPFHTEILKKTNQVNITFPDSGGKVSSVILQTELVE